MEREGGNIVLEYLLTIPTAFLIFFASIDQGLIWLEQGALDATLRSASRESIVGSARTIPGTVQSISWEVLAEQMYKHARVRLTQAKQHSIGYNRDEIAVVVELLSLEINPGTGEVKAWQLLSRHSDSFASSLNATSSLTKHLNESPSSFAIPEHRYALHRDVVSNYRPHALLAYVGVVTKPNGIGQGVRQVLESFNKQLTGEVLVSFGVPQ